MDCDIVLVGLNHRTAGVDVRERFALVDFCSRENWALPCDDVIGEAMILSTCNRVELLATGHGDVAGRILERWATARGTDPEELRPYVYIYKNMDAVRHLFSVASSLDSMILGEPQILQAMEHSALESPCYLPIAVKKDGSVSGLAASVLADAAQMGKMGRYVDELLRKVARELGDGNIDADPCRRGPQESACDWCPFASACWFDEKRDKPHYLQKTTPEEFWQLVDEEVTRRG